MFGDSEKEIERKRMIERENEFNDIRNVMNTKEGLRFMRRILDRCGLHQQPAYRLGSEDRQTYISCGMLDIGLWILSELDKAVDDRNLLTEVIFRSKPESKESASCSV